MSKYIYILLTIFFTAYGQLAIKWRMNQLNYLPERVLPKLIFLAKIISTDFMVMSAFMSAFVAALFWMLAIKKIQLNQAYPLMSLSFVIVCFASTFLFHEKVTGLQITGLTLIVIGVSLVGASFRAMS